MSIILREPIVRPLADWLYLSPPKGAEATAANLVAAHLFFEGIAQGKRNLAYRNAVDAAVIGAPVDNTGYVQFDGNQNYLVTTVRDSDLVAGTFIIFGREPEDGATPATRAPFIGSYNATVTAAGANIYQRDPDSVSGHLDYTNGSSNLSARFMEPLANPTGFHALAMGWDATTIRLKELTNGYANTDYALPAGYTRRTNSAYVTIGGLPSSTIEGKSDIFGALIFNRILTLLEMQAWRTWGAAVAAPYGITV